MNDEIARVATSLQSLIQRNEEDHGAILDLLGKQNDRVRKMEIWQATIKGAGMAIKGMWVVVVSVFGVAGGFLGALLAQLVGK